MSIEDDVKRIFMSIKINIRQRSKKKARNFVEKEEKNRTIFPYLYNEIRFLSLNSYFDSGFVLNSLLPW